MEGVNKSHCMVRPVSLYLCLGLAAQAPAEPWGDEDNAAVPTADLATPRVPAPLLEPTQAGSPETAASVPVSAWVRKWDAPSGRHFYMNKSLRKTQWRVRLHLLVNTLASKRQCGLSAWCLFAVGQSPAEGWVDEASARAQSKALSQSKETIGQGTNLVWIRKMDTMSGQFFYVEMQSRKKQWEV